jgi:hypothetical protein
MSKLTTLSKFTKQDAKDSRQLITELLQSENIKDANSIGEELISAVNAMVRNKIAYLEAAETFRKNFAELCDDLLGEAK